MAALVAENGVPEARVRVIPNWAPGGDELTPTMKLKRKPIGAKYEAQIEALYA